VRKRFSPKPVAIVWEGVGPAPHKGKLVGEAELTKKVSLGDGTSRTFTIGSALTPKKESALIAFLLENSDVFPWELSDLSGVPREVIEHHLAVCPEAHPIKQKVRRQVQDRQDFIVKEVRKLDKTKVIREVVHTTWEANPIVVPKTNRAMRMCINFTDLNKPYDCPEM
jgi:hypothetical protein